MTNHYLNSPISLSVKKNYVSNGMQSQQDDTRHIGIISNRKSKYETLPRVSQTITKNHIGLPQINTNNNYSEFFKKLTNSQAKKKQWIIENSSKKGNITPDRKKNKLT